MKIKSENSSYKEELDQDTNAIMSAAEKGHIIMTDPDGFEYVDSADIRWILGKPADRFSSADVALSGRPKTSCYLLSDISSKSKILTGSIAREIGKLNSLLRSSGGDFDGVFIDAVKATPQIIMTAGDFPKSYELDEAGDTTATKLAVTTRLGAKVNTKKHDDGGAGGETGGGVSTTNGAGERRASASGSGGNSPVGHHLGFFRSQGNY